MSTRAKHPNQLTRAAQDAGREKMRRNKEEARKELPSPDNRLPGGWKPRYLTLIVDTRHCSCGATYVCPNPRLMMELINPRNHATRLVNVTNLDIATSTVPRILQEVESDCQHCPKCFEPEPNGRAPREAFSFKEKSPETTVYTADPRKGNMAVATLSIDDLIS